MTAASAAAGSVSVEFAESIPQQLPLATALSTFDAWCGLLSAAKATVDIGQYYWSLSDGAAFPAQGGADGAKVFALIRGLHARGVRVRILQNAPSASMPCNETAALAREGLAEVLTVDFARLGVGGGIFHTKMLVVDGASVYVGSANADWRSLTQVKECGVVVRGEPRVAEDALRIFDAVWSAARDGKLPPKWPSALAALGNASSPLVYDAEGYPGVRSYFAVSPPQFCTEGRTDAVESTLRVIEDAKESISIEVMDYFPASFYMTPNIFWPVVDNALRDAAFRGVHVRMLVSLWNHTSPAIKQYLVALNALDGIEIRWFVVPELLPPLTPVPYTRVNHAKFMVTEKTVYVSTSNWSADYFLGACLHSVPISFSHPFS